MCRPYKYEENFLEGRAINSAKCWQDEVWELTGGFEKETQSNIDPQTSIKNTDKVYLMITLNLLFSCTI